MASIIKRIEVLSKSNRCPGAYNIYEVLDNGIAYLRIYDTKNPEIRVTLDADDVEECSEYYWGTTSKSKRRPKGYIRAVLRDNNKFIGWMQLQQLIYDRHVNISEYGHICFRDGDSYNCRMENLTTPRNRGVIACRRNNSRIPKLFDLPVGMTVYGHCTENGVRQYKGVRIKCIYGNLTLKVDRFGSIENCVDIAKAIYKNILDNTDFKKDTVEMQAYFKVIQMILGMSI